MLIWTDSDVKLGGRSGFMPPAICTLVKFVPLPDSISTAMKSLRSFTLVFCLCLAGCATTPKINTDFKPGTDFSRFKTFALLPLPAQAPASDPGLFVRVAEPARQAVVESLAAKGLREVDRAQADCTINLRGSSLPRVEIKDWGYTTWSYGLGTVPVHTGERQIRSYAERTLIIEIFDNHSKELAWVGWAKGEGYGKVKVERLQVVIRQILALFPPGPEQAQK